MTHGVMPSAVLVHGRHVETIGWSRLVWGIPEENRLGSLPTTVRLLLSESSDRPVETLLFGTGASRTAEGVVEAQAMKNHLTDRFDELEGFETLKSHPGMRTLRMRDRLLERILAAETEETSQNTAEEIAAVAKIITARGIRFVQHVTAASHAPRCMQLQTIAREGSNPIIPRWQLWSVVADDMTFRDLPASAATILEPWHRGDVAKEIRDSTDPPIEAVMKGYFGLPPNNQLALTRDIAARMKSFEHD